MTKGEVLDLIQAEIRHAQEMIKEAGRDRVLRDRWQGVVWGQEALIKILEIRWKT